ncbi:dTDP-4-dehydrorhamnose reductase [Aquimarina agarivorans]|uniref:dTDP-4-dehydrorhamnose reductase n=1 Tax=Aquimarina agarivorans TaxID=980584 RepID=UPI000248EC15|nr:dTDP-4-dehydrorhamnose reductase [Aquimarina agarivorans]
MNNILITGANGQVGSEIKELSEQYKNFNFIFTDIDELDITNYSKVDTFIQTNKVHSIVNCAAYTAVEKAEDEPLIAKLINHKATENLALVAKKNELPLIHISTDYVFDGNSSVPYKEDDSTNPLNIYGKTKHDGELVLKKINPKKSIIIRTAWVYSSFGNNFVKSMLRLGKEKNTLNVIYDQIGCPTYARDLAQLILTILPKLKNDTVETYHYANEGVCSWFDFSKAIFEFKNIQCKVNAIPTSAYPTKTARPHFSLLNKQKVKDTFSVSIPYWKDSLKECLQKI